MNNRSLRILLICVITQFAFFQAHIAIASSDNDTPGSVTNQQMIYTDEDCSVMEWDANSGKSHLIYKRDDCPQKLFIQSGGNTAFLVYGETLIVLDLTDPALKTTIIALPSPKLPKDVAMNSEQVGFVQYTKNGRLAVEITSVDSFDSDHDFLFEHVNNEWILSDAVICGRFSSCTAVGGKDKSNTMNIDAGFSTYSSGRPYKSSTALYNLPDSHNPYLISITKKNEVEYEGDDGQTWIAHFNFGRSTSALKFIIIDGPDSDLPFLFGISIITSDGNEVTLTHDQCDASLLGRYLIVNGYQNMHTALIDLATGKALLTNLGWALWRQ